MSNNNTKRRRRQRHRDNGQQNGHANGQNNGHVKELITQDPIADVQIKEQYQGGPFYAEGGAVTIEDESAEWMWVTCDRKPFDGIQVEVNVHFVPSDIDSLPGQLVDGIPQTVVRNVKGWSFTKWPKPFQGEGPMTFVLWAALVAPSMGVRQFVNDPNFSTE